MITKFKKFPPHQSRSVRVCLGERAPLLVLVTPPLVLWFTATAVRLAGKDYGIDVSAGALDGVFSHSSENYYGSQMVTMLAGRWLLSTKGYFFENWFIAIHPQKKYD